MDILLAPIAWIIKAPFVLIGWIIVGAVAGDLARRFMKSQDLPFWQDLVLGIIGAFIGGWIASILGIGKPDGGLALVFVNLVIATVGAALIIAIRRRFVGGRSAN